MESIVWWDYSAIQAWHQQTDHETICTMFTRLKVNYINNNLNHKMLNIIINYI